MVQRSSVPSFPTCEEHCLYSPNKLWGSDHHAQSPLFAIHRALQPPPPPPPKKSRSHCLWEFGHGCVLCLPTRWS